MSPEGALTIGVHHDDRVAPRRQQSGQDARLVDEVSRETQSAHRAVCLLLGLDLSPRPSVLPSSTIMSLSSHALAADMIAPTTSGSAASSLWAGNTTDTRSLSGVIEARIRRTSRSLREGRNVF